jgi:hypothetical protein
MLFSSSGSRLSCRGSAMDIDLVWQRVLPMCYLRALGPSYWILEMANGRDYMTIYAVTDPPFDSA